MKPWLVGENNPYSSNAHEVRFDLFPYPKNCSGWRLCHLVLGVSRRDYLENFERRNLLRQSRWSAPAARDAAQKLLSESAGAPLVLLGSKVSQAFGLAYDPFVVVEFDGRLAAVLPHPSGLNQMWNEPGAFVRARDTVSCLCAAARGEVVA